MTDTPRSTPPLIDELRAILAALEHARRALANGDLSKIDELWLRLDNCARRLAVLDREGRDGVKPVMLALLDELERTIESFGAERQNLVDKLKSTSRSMAAGAAYLQAKAR